MAPAKFKDASYVLSYQDSLFPDQDRLVRTIQPKKKQKSLRFMPYCSVQKMSLKKLFLDFRRSRWSSIFYDEIKFCFPLLHYLEHNWRLVWRSPVKWIHLLFPACAQKERASIASSLVLLLFLTSTTKWSYHIIFSESTIHSRWSLQANTSPIMTIKSVFGLFYRKESVSRFWILNWILTY